MAEIFNFFFLTFENKLKNELEKFLLQKNSRKTKWPEGSMYWHIFEKIAKKLNMKSGADKRRFLDCSKIVQKLCFVLGLVTLISFFLQFSQKCTRVCRPLSVNLKCHFEPTRRTSRTTPMWGSTKKSLSYTNFHKRPNDRNGRYTPARIW